MHKYRKLYVIENQDGNVKIGVSGNPSQRVKAIKNQTGYKICRVYETENCYNPFEMEKEILKRYENKKIYGEWIEEKFDKIVSDLKIIFNDSAVLEDNTPEYSADALFRYFHPEDFED